MAFEKLFGKKANSTSIENENEAIPSGDIAAIAMALHLFYDEVHDDESNVITIKRIERRYSPWSSKIYGVINNR
jgi:glutaconyl-CoA/methylmalonyl-CoA decarboxylase subunit delta